MLSKNKFITKNMYHNDSLVRAFEGIVSKKYIFPYQSKNRHTGRHSRGYC